MGVGVWGWGWVGTGVWGGIGVWGGGGGVGEGVGVGGGGGQTLCRGGDWMGPVINLLTLTQVGIVGVMPYLIDKFGSDRDPSYEELQEGHDRGCMK
jgi:hypothetical protein